MKRIMPLNILGYEFENLSETAKNNVISREIEDLLETHDYDSLVELGFEKALEKANENQTPWFIPQYMYEENKEDFIKHFLGSDTLYDENGEVIQIVYKDVNGKQVPFLQITNSIEIEVEIVEEGLRFNGLEHSDDFGEAIIAYFEVSNVPEELEKIAKKIDKKNYNALGYGFCLNYNKKERTSFITSDGGNEIYYIDHIGNKHYLKGSRVPEEIKEKAFSSLNISKKRNAYRLAWGHDFDDSEYMIIDAESEAIETLIREMKEIAEKEDHDRCDSDIFEELLEKSKISFEVLKFKTLDFY